MSNNNAKILKTARIKAEKEIKSMVTIMGNDALNHFEASFRNQGFTNEGFKRWQTRKGEVSGFGVSKKSKGSRAILTRTGRLRRSLKRNKVGQYAIRISSNVPYAEIHNDGGLVYRKPHKRVATRTVRVRGSYGQLGDERVRGKKMQIMGERHNVSASSFKMPKRQFVGYSAKLNRLLINKFNMKIHSIF